MKVCKKCGRVKRNKSWGIAKQGEVARARLMERLEETHCEDCLRHGESFVATLQVRGRFDRKIVENMINDEMNRSDKKGNHENVYIREGDYRFTSKPMANKIARQLAELGAEINMTSKVITYDFLRSKEKKRLTLVARFTFVIGDVIEINKQLEIISKVSQGWIWTMSGKKVRSKGLKIIDVEHVDGIVISEKPPMIFIEKTNETIEIEHNKKHGETVKLLRKEKWIRCLNF